MPSKNRSTPSSEKSISISGDVKDSVVIAGDNNVITKQTTIIQKFFNIFKSDAETLEQRNRRILLNHVENAWIKGVLDASLHGAALLDLGIKQDPEAVKTYPWAIKKESTDETLPAGTSMLEIFDSIGMGRSLLILGAPGSGKTTMLLELARQLIQYAREDVTYPIPMVFNLASWTEKLTLTDWLAQELNNLYSVPRKTAPDWVNGNKLLLLLDGLDEVRQESRVKCVEAINAFRKEHGLTSLAVCSRSQDYADLNAKLSFEGAIEVQPLTQKQITEFFNRFGKEMAGIKQVLEKDSGLREMAETPLFLSIMLMAYRDKRDVDILVSGDKKAQRKHLFDTYIEQMFVHLPLKKDIFKNQDISYWLSWLAHNMVLLNQTLYLIEGMQPDWLNRIKKRSYRWASGSIIGFVVGVSFFLSWKSYVTLHVSLISGLFLGSLWGIVFSDTSIKMLDRVVWEWKNARNEIVGLLITIGLTTLVFAWLKDVSFGLISGLIIGAFQLFHLGFVLNPVSQVVYPGQRISFWVQNTFLYFCIYFLIGGLSIGILFSSFFDVNFRVILGLWFGVFGGLGFGGYSIIQHNTLRFILARNNLLPWRLVPFLDHCVDLIFLRGVGGGYIFVHRLLMEHFAEMYVESPTSKGN